MRTSRLFFGDWTGIVALVLSLLGASFLATWLPLAAWGKPGRIAASILLGAASVILGVGLFLWARRAAVLRRAERLLQEGTPSSGTITCVRPYIWLRVNRRYPLEVRYRYQTNESTYESSEVLWDLSQGSRVGGSVMIVYDPSQPSRSILKL